jgi:precorrin-2 dehydrogenase / sirohydrochlorin ferrochelatase
MSRVCEQWSLEDLTEMDEKDMLQLLKYWPAGEVPTYEEVLLGDEFDPFDGSFGFACGI